MARSITQILFGLKVSMTGFASSIGITIVPNNWSKTDYKSLMLNTVASATGLQEQQFDQVKQDTEDVKRKLPPQTYPWLQDQMINNFEYDAVGVPIVQLNTATDFTPYYPNPNPNYKIIKYCNPFSAGLGVTTIKVAGVGPSKITGAALDAAQTFANTIAVPGITYNVVSKDADRLFMQLNVDYNGLYAAVIEANVISAITTFLNSLSTTNFDGILRLIDLSVAIKAVTGVVDVVFDNVRPRPNTTTVGGGINMILNNTEILSRYQCEAGYIILEDTAAANWRLSDFRVGASGIKNLNLQPV